MLKSGRQGTITSPDTFSSNPTLQHPQSREAPTERWGFSRVLPAVRSTPVLGALDPTAPTPLGHDSLLRRVAAEPVTALLVQRALVMEVAHPMVGAGVDHHSGFRTQPYRRAWATADAALRLLFGDDGTARGAARQIYAVHDHINGELGHDVGPWPQGTAYSAHDAELLTWVWATLVDTALVGYERWVRPLRADEADAFYGEMKAMARFLGIPDSLLPAGRTEFAAYLEHVLDDPALGSGTVSRALARQILWYRHWSVPAPVVRLERVLALATLDPRLLERLDLHPSPSDEALGRRVDGWLAAGYRHLPRPGTSLPRLYVRLRAVRVPVGSGVGRRLRRRWG